MKKVKTIFGAILFATIILTSCGGSDKKTSEDVKEVKKDTPPEPSPNESEKISADKTNGLTAELLGNYHGIQPSYFMKNQYGDDMVINGNKVSVPSIDYKFLFKENTIVSLQQINLEDNSRVYYNGTYKIISEESITTKIECSLSDGQGSNPTYVLTINKSDKKGICTGNNEPEFSIEKK
ncbi:MAG: hypothetical protein ISP69_05660 [Crocinitomicaceae bacterium]|nr:hypothetical protein [Crocinitomicaceae bacterium]